jgi:hypothetical protein
MFRTVPAVTAELGYKNKAPGPHLRLTVFRYNLRMNIELLRWCEQAFSARLRSVVADPVVARSADRQEEPLIAQETANPPPDVMNLGRAPLAHPGDSGHALRMLFQEDVAHLVILTVLALSLLRHGLQAGSFHSIVPRSAEIA